MAESRRTRGPAYKHTRWARCVFCGLLRKYKVSAARRLRAQTCQECNRKGGLHPPNWAGWHDTAKQWYAIKDGLDAE